MHDATINDFSNATELADYLATKGVPFRQAHEIVGELVLKGIQTKTSLQDMPLAELQQAAPQIEEDVYTELSSEAAVNRRTSLGGTAVSNVKKEVKRAQGILLNTRKLKKPQIDVDLRLFAWHDQNFILMAQMIAITKKSPPTTISNVNSSAWWSAISAEAICLQSPQSLPQDLDHVQ